MTKLRRIASWAVFAALGLASCKEAPPPPPNEPPPAASSNDPDEIVLLEQQRSRAAPHSSAGPASSAEARPSAGPDVLALLGGLKPADKLGTLEVVRISSVTQGSVVLDLGNGAETGTIFFVKLGDGPSPPASSVKYAVYYRDEKAPHPIANDALQVACTALANRLRKNEASQPMPAGLTAFVADKAKSSTENAL